MSVQHVRRGIEAETAPARLAAMVAAALRRGQERSALGLGALVGFGLALDARDDPVRLVVAGAAGVLLLSLALFRQHPPRLLFAVPSLLLFATYVWTGQESVGLEVEVQGAELRATLTETTLTTTVPRRLDGRLGLAMASGEAASTDDDHSVLVSIGRRLARLVSSNLGAAAVVSVSTADGSLLAGPLTFLESDFAGPPLTVDGPNYDLDPTFPALLFGDPGWHDLQIGLELRAGRAPTTLLLGLDRNLNGLAVQAWPANRSLAILEVVAGVPGRELTGGYLTLRRPPLAGLQALARELLRAWLIGLALIALGIALARLARMIPGPDAWWAPPGAGLLGAVGLAAAGLIATAWIASDVLERIPHVQDSVAYLFQARTFALGRLSAPLPAFPAAFEQEFILMRDGAWFSKYPPGYPVILALGVLAGAPWLVSPLAASVTLLLQYALGRALFGGGSGLLGALLLLASPFFLFMSGSFMSHPFCLLLTTLALLLVVRIARGASSWFPVAAGLALGWLSVSRQLTGLAVTAPALIWLGWRLWRARRSLAPLPTILLGWSWPLLMLFAYNRALTGNPLVNPFELWWSFDRFGFGSDVGLHNGHDLGRGLSNTLLNLEALQGELFGWPLYLTLAFVPLPFALGRARSGDWLLAGVSLTLVTAYLFYWADGQMYGPRYYYEASGCLALLTARGLVCAAEAAAGATRTFLRRRAPPATGAVYAALVVGLVAGNIWQNLPAQIAAHRGYNSVDGRRLSATRAAGLERAVVLVPTTAPAAWWEYGSVFSANDPLLNADVIFGRDLGPEANRRTLAAFPDRAGYRLDGDRLTRLSAP